MNIIQVGRPAVSRYHQINKFYAEGEGPDYAVHDFPNAAYGIKLGQGWSQVGRGWQSALPSTLHIILDMYCSYSILLVNVITNDDDDDDGIRHDDGTHTHNPHTHTHTHNTHGRTTLTAMHIHDVSGDEFVIFVAGTPQDP